jgi:adenine-specific DNA-methyltransferase
VVTTAYHARWWAESLSLIGHGAHGGIDRVAPAIANARVDLNPHQVEAALAALRSPLSRGMLLADEVGLGKTIEAGIVIAQRWAERKRRILIVVPASLRKQWRAELASKFELPSVIMDKKEASGRGTANAFDTTNEVVICSYEFASASGRQIGEVAWDLVVFDEAHRLRNSNTRRYQQLDKATKGRHKLLLTATPLQNSRPCPVSC